jgi:hypothetical protein
MQTPPPTPDEEHLKLLAVFHYILGGFHIFISCFFLMYVAMGILFALSPTMLPPEFIAVPDTPSPPAPPPLEGAPELPAPPTLDPKPAPVAAMGWFFAVFGAVGFLIGCAFGILTIISGRKIAQRKNRTFSFVIAAINCLSLPFGTALGIFTIIVLNRPSVQTLYQDSAPS